MHSNEFALMQNEEIFDTFFDFDELEKELENQLKIELSELEFLKEEQEKIGNPDNLGKVIQDVVWEQFINQVGIVAGEDFIEENGGMTLDLRNEAHIQTTENFANGKIATHNTKIDFQERYDNWKKNFQRNTNGTFKTKIDNRTGEEQIVLRVQNKKKDPNGENYNTNYNARKFIDKNRPKGSKSIHKDHTISAAEIIRDPEANAHLTRKELENFANDKINLIDLDSSANESKSDSKMTDWLNSKRNGKSPKERFNIDDKKLIKRDEIARKEYKKRKEEGNQKSIETGRQSQKEEAFRIGNSAIRAVVMRLLINFIREIIIKLIKWFKTTKANFELFFESIKEATLSFIGNMKTHLISAADTLFTTMATAIIGPVFETIKKVFMLLKQGWNSIKTAIDYIKNPKNKNQPISRLILEIGKILTVGLTGMGAITLSEVIEKGLSSIPILLTPIPFFGNLANIIGIFMGGVVSGIIGAIIINLIQRMIKAQLEIENTNKKISKKNEILKIQHKIINLNENKVGKIKKILNNNIEERHKKATDYITDTMNKIFNEEKSSVEKSKVNENKIDEINSLLEKLI